MMTPKTIENVEINFSEQAQLLIEKISDFDLAEFISWFVKEKKITAGGGDVVDFLKWKKGDNNGGLG